MIARSFVFVVWVTFGIGSAMATDSIASEDSTSRPSLRWSIKLSAGADVGPKHSPDEPSRNRPGSWRVSFDFHITMEASVSAARPSSLESTPPVPADETLTEAERELVELTNKERTKAKLPPLKVDPVLMKLAREQTARMVRLNQAGHELEGETFSKRMKAVDYHALAAGENCAEGARTPAEAVADWMTSVGHKASILSDKYTHLGVAQGTSKEGKTFSTQVFAKPFELPALPKNDK